MAVAGVVNLDDETGKLSGREDLHFDGIAAGTTIFEVVPPTDVVFDGGVPGSPSNPLQITEVKENTVEYELSFGVEDGLPKGAGDWMVVVRLEPGDFVA